MHLVINALCKTVLLPVMLAASAISCVSAKPLSEVSKVSTMAKTIQASQKNSNTSQNVKLEFYTIYDSEKKCDQKNFGFTWQKVKDDLARYDMGMNKIDWLFAPSMCTQVITPNFNHVVITEFMDKNSLLRAYYIHHTKQNKRILLKLERDDWLQSSSKGKYKYFGDVDSFPEGKFILNQYIYEQDQ
ncbi:hypothetical protein [Psychrobacter aestuarii]|uniref:Lipoprotein n=1 Tax=Psychrobacter aestuarii TaxID=556327 RepID=A0ABP3FAN0_9GAMM|nr:hypothetical protein [Psychrobacter aestuarii]